MRAIEIRIVADVVRQHAAVERRQQLDEILADKSAADDAERSGRSAAGRRASATAPPRSATLVSGTRCSSAIANASVSSATERRLTPPVQPSLMPRRANRLDVDAVEADAVLADDLQLRHLRQDVHRRRARGRRWRDRGRAGARRARRRRAPPRDSVNVTSGYFADSSARSVGVARERSRRRRDDPGRHARPGRDSARSASCHGGIA